jgi:putative heme transporter
VTAARTSTRARVRRALVIVVVLAAAVLAGRVLYDNSDELLAAADTVSHPVWAWVVVGVVAEVLSYLLRGAAHSVVLRAGAGDGGRGGTRLPGVGVLSGAVLAGDAAAYCLPLGFAASGMVIFEVLRRRQVDSTLTGWMYAMCAAQYVGSIALLTLLAVELAGSSDPIPGLWQVSLGVVVVLVLAGVGYGLVWRHRRRSGGITAADPGAAPRGSRVRRWLRARLAELRRIRLPARIGVLAFALLTISWLCNIVVLAVAHEAVGGTPPWAGLLLAYCASQIAAALPVTPGGLGVVEGSLTLALVAFGGAEQVTLAAVLLYRLITYWICIPAGGLAWLALRATGTPSRPPLPDPATAAPRGGRR